MKMRLLTEEQKNLLVGKLFDDEQFFNPIQDANDNWVISEQEVSGCDKEEFSWVKHLPEIDYIQKEVDLDTINL